MGNARRAEGGGRGWKHKPRQGRFFPQGTGGHWALPLLTGDLAGLGGRLGERPSRDETGLGHETVSLPT